MDRNAAPAWLVVMLGFFVLTTFVSFGTFLYYFAESEGVQEQKEALEQEIEVLNVLTSRLPDERDALSQALQTRYLKDAELDQSDQDEINATKASLSPKHDSALKMLQDLNQQKIARLKRLIQEADEARGELKAAEENRLEAETSGQQERRRLRDKIEQVSVDIESKKKDQLTTILDLEKELKQREDRIQELLDRRETKVETITSDGQLLEARVDDGFVIINRGLYDDIRFAQRFVVFNRRGGKNVVKGQIEVIEVMPHVAVARVLQEVDRNDPLIPGDHIHNNIYNPDEVKIYVIAGDFEVYSPAELKQFIVETGGQVEREITAKTHYLVAGFQNADEALQQAALGGVTVLSEHQLLDVVRRTDRYEIERGMTYALAGDFTEVDRNVIEEFIIANGGVIDGDIGEETNILIVGENAAEAISEAYLHGVTVIDQTQLRALMIAGAATGDDDNAIDAEPAATQEGK